MRITEFSRYGENMSQRKRPQIEIHDQEKGWLALDRKTFVRVGRGATITEAERQAHEHGVDRPLLLAIPKSEGYFVGIG